MVLVSCNGDKPDAANNDQEVIEVIEPSQRPLIIINGHEITIGEFEQYYAKQSYGLEKEYGAEIWNIEKDGKTMAEIRRDQTIDYLVRVHLIEEYLLDKGVSVDQAVIDENYQSYMLKIKDDTEMLTYFEENDIDEAFIKGLLKDQYNLNKFEEVILEEVKNDEEKVNTLFENRVIRYKVRHILLEDETALAEVLALLNDEEDPQDFSDMARLFSTHSTSAVRGGDLGYTLIGNMPEAFEEVALSIDMYTVSEGVQTEYGYHIIFVDDRQMLSDMVEIGMPEDEMNTYKDEIIKRYAEEETLSVFNDLKKNLDLEVKRELFEEEQE